MLHTALAVLQSIINTRLLAINMQIFEIILSFVIGTLLISTIAFISSLKTKGVFRILINSAAGGIILLLLNFFEVASLPLNPLNALIIGVLGVPGLFVVFLLVKLYS